jgi:hypothetical protein
MKTIFTLCLALQLFILACTAQITDMNGLPVSVTNPGLNPPYQNNAFAPVVYDSVRHLSETNVTGMADAYPWISADGLRLYYHSASLYNMAFTSRPNVTSYFNPPVLGNAIFPSGTFSAWFSADELDVYYIVSGSIYYAHRASIGSSFSTPVLITVSGASPFSAISLDPTQNELYFYASGISRCVRTSPTSFVYTYDLPVTINNFNPGQLSKDGLSFFVSIDGAGSDIYSYTRATLNDSLTNPQLVQGINIPGNPYNTQPTLSDNLEWMVFVSSTADLWTEDELAIAHKGTTTSVFDPAQEKPGTTVFPNPVSERLNFRIGKSYGKNVFVKIYSVENTLVEEKFIGDNNAFLDVSKYKHGIYFYKISGHDNALIHAGRFTVIH